VAILSPSDEFHRQCVDVLKSLAPPLYTCWLVLTETAWLLRADPEAVETLLRGDAAGFYNILALGDEDAEAIAGVLKRYRNLRPQLADAALVQLRKENASKPYSLLIAAIFACTVRVLNGYSRSSRSPLYGHSILGLPGGACLGLR